MNFSEDDALESAVAKKEAESADYASTAPKIATAAEAAVHLAEVRKRIDGLKIIEDAYAEQLLDLMKVDREMPGDTDALLDNMHVNISVPEKWTWDQDKLAALAVTSTSVRSLKHRFSVDRRQFQKADAVERELLQPALTISAGKPRVTVKESTVVR